MSRASEERFFSLLVRSFLFVPIALTLGAASAFAQIKPDALAMYRAGKFDDARATCLAEIAQNPANIESYVVLVWSLLSLERYADAELYGTKAWASVRKDPRIAQSLGEAMYHQGKNQQALDRFKDYINLLPDGATMGTIYYYIAETYLRMESLEHADIAMRTALQYEPNNARWWTRLGYIRERAADWSFALEAYQSALSINPGFVDAVRGKERVLAKVRR